MAPQMPTQMAAEIVVETAHPPERPTLLFEGDESICRRAVARWSASGPRSVDWLPWRSARARFPDLPESQLASAPTLVLPSGEVFSGARAVLRALHLSGRELPWFFYRRYVGVSLLVDAIFSFASRRRALLSRIARTLAGPDERPPSHHLARWTFLRGLGISALAAFLSVRAQLDGLIGSGGVLPVAPTLAQVRAWAEQNGVGALGTFRRFPTLFLWASSDRALHVVTWIGIVASVMLVVDVAPPIALGAIWLCYLSLVTAGDAFFHFQWDALLLETCLVAAFVVPWRVVPRRIDRAPPRESGLWLVRLLVFKLMFLSGVVKITSKDPTWSSLTALDYHYFTQPIPTWTAWYAHHAPQWVHRASAVGTFVVELGAPFLIFGSRRMRRIAFALFAALMVGVGATGNYGFFNLLSIVVALVLLDDGAFPAWLRRRLSPPLELVRDASRRFARILRTLAVSLVGALSLTYVLLAFVDDPRDTLPETWIDLVEVTAPFDSINSYGLFRTMTTKRPEILVEGSDDGTTWKAYEFPWKPGDPMRRPEFIGVHMPRLDWQLWFAALAGHCTRSPAYLGLLRALLEGSPPVRALLAHDPFADRPPKYLRSTLWDYTFSSKEERAQTGAWWSRRRLGVYCPTVMLDGGDLVPVEP